MNTQLRLASGASFRNFESTSTAVSAVCVCISGAADVTVTVSDIARLESQGNVQAVGDVHHDVVLAPWFQSSAPKR